MSKAKDDRLRALPTREQRAWQWFLEATERGDKMSADDCAGMLAKFADFEGESMDKRIRSLEFETARLTERLQAADDDRHHAFMALPVTPNPQMAWAGLIYPHAVRVADEFALRTAQNQEHERAIARLEAQLAEAKALLETARPYLRGIRSTNPAPYMDGSAYPGWLDEPRTAAKKKPAEWWAALDALRTGIDALLAQERTDEK